ncbi:MAG: hypothetical protein DMF74_11755 [Acidobacteria bacterium]|nr:MAG: hypothetical protein DMF74_11755 [Acidobacteriota bacterium]
MYIEEAIMSEVRRPIDPRDFTKIPRIREIIKTLPEEIRVCSKHGEEVSIQESDFSLNPEPAAPFNRADWVGCCEEAIDKVIEGVQETLELIDRAKQTYVDELARKLEPEHTGKIVAIELGTNEYFVGDDELTASDKARASGHAGALFFLRVGSPYAHRLMTPRQ